MKNALPRLLTLALVLPAALGACATGPMGTADDGEGGTKKVELKASFDRFPDMPMPNGYSFDMGRTLIFGSNDSWFGRMALKLDFGPNEMFDFYKQELPRFGWKEVTAIRAPVSVLTYTREERVATLQIQSRTITGSEVLITVSPANAPASVSPASAPRVQTNR